MVFITASESERGQSINKGVETEDTWRKKGICDVATWSGGLNKAKCRCFEMGGEDILGGRLFGTEWDITSFVLGNCEWGYLGHLLARNNQGSHIKSKEHLTSNESSEKLKQFPGQYFRGEEKPSKSGNMVSAFALREPEFWANLSFCFVYQNHSQRPA